MNEVWIVIVTTDRPAAFQQLCHDVIDRARAAQVRPRLLIIENSAKPASRAANVQELARLDAHVEIQTTPHRVSIAESRAAATGLVAESLRRHQPQLIWMLDDDVRLTHVVWSGSILERKPLYNPFDHLLQVRQRHPDVDVLIGSVTGDPPIPAVATLASRMSDLSYNLGQLFSRLPGEPWVPDAKSVATLMEPDAYYDLSAERPPPWFSPVKWLPRSAMATAASVWRELVGCAHEIPFGAAYTRPILARPDAPDPLSDNTRRGANAVFFDANACITHAYPMLDVGGVTTRRSDMIGSRLLAHARPGRVRSSAFSVAHTRPTNGSWPTRADLFRTLVSDSYGALLAREVEGALTGIGVRDFMSARVERLRQAATQLQVASGEVADHLKRAPAWADASGPLLRVLAWVKAAVPFGLGIVPEDLLRALTNPAALRRVTEYARTLGSPP